MTLPAPKTVRLRSALSALAETETETEAIVVIQTWWAARSEAKDCLFHLDECLNDIKQAAIDEAAKSRIDSVLYLCELYRARRQEIASKFVLLNEVLADLCVRSDATPDNVRRLIEAGANPNSASSFWNNNALGLASGVHTANWPVVETLLELGANETQCYGWAQKIGDPQEWLARVKARSERLKDVDPLFWSLIDAENGYEI